MATESTEPTQADDNPQDLAAHKEAAGEKAKVLGVVEHTVFEDLTDAEAEALGPEHRAKLNEIDGKKQAMEAKREEHRKAMKVLSDEAAALEKEERRLRNACETKQRARTIKVREFLLFSTQSVIGRECLEHGKLGSEVILERPAKPDELKALQNERQRDWVKEEEEKKAKAPKPGEPLKASVGEQQRAKKSSSKKGSKRSKRPQAEAP